MATLGNLQIGINVDLTGLTDGLARVRAEMASFTDSQGKASSASADLQKSTDKTETSVKKLGDTSSASGNVISNAFSKLGTSFKNLFDNESKATAGSDAFSKSANGLKNLPSDAVNGLTTAFKSMSTGADTAATSVDTAGKSSQGAMASFNQLSATFGNALIPALLGLAVALGVPTLPMAALVVGAAGAAAAIALVVGPVIALGAGIVALASYAGGWTSSSANLTTAQTNLKTATAANTTAQNALARAHTSVASSAKPSASATLSLQQAQASATTASNNLATAQNNLAKAQTTAGNPLTELTNDFKAMAKTLGQEAMPIATNLLQWVDQFIPKLQLLGQAAIEWFGNNMTGILGLLSTMANVALKAISDLGTDWADFYNKMTSGKIDISEISNLFETLGTQTVKGLLDNLYRLTDWFQTNLNGQMGTNAGQFFSNLGNGIQGALTLLGEFLDGITKLESFFAKPGGSTPGSVAGPTAPAAAAPNPVNGLSPGGSTNAGSSSNSAVPPAIQAGGWLAQSIATGLANASAQLQSGIASALSKVDWTALGSQAGNSAGPAFWGGFANPFTKAAQQQGGAQGSAFGQVFATLFGANVKLGAAPGSVQADMEQFASSFIKTTIVDPFVKQLQSPTTAGPISQALGNFFGSAFSSLGTIITKSITGVANYFGQLPGKIASVLGSALTNAICAPFEAAYNALVGHSIVPDTVNAILWWFGLLPNSVRSIWNTLINDVNSDWGRIQSLITSAAQNIANTVGGMFNGLGTAFHNAILGAGRTLRDDVDNYLIQPLDNFINNIDNSVLVKNLGMPGIPDVGYIPGFATGGIVPGSGSGDTVPAMLTPGEVILSKLAVDSLGGANAANTLNQRGAGPGAPGATPGTWGGQCVVFVEAEEGVHFPVAIASQMTSYINSQTPKIGEIFVSTIPPDGHTGIINGPNSVIDSNWGLDEMIQIHSLSGIPDIAGYIDLGAGLPAGLPTGTGGASPMTDITSLIKNAVGGSGLANLPAWLGSLPNNLIGQAAEAIGNSAKSKIGSAASWVGNSLQAIGLSNGGIVPGAGTGDTIPAMLTPGERVLSVGREDQLGQKLDAVVAAIEVLQKKALGTVTINGADQKTANQIVNDISFRGYAATI